MIKQKQKNALEIITGRTWDSWNSEAVDAYFAWTDTGKRVQVSDSAKNDLVALLHAHKTHPITVEMWKQDFCGKTTNGKPTLFLGDFLNQGYPDAYVKHACQIYLSVKG